MKVIGITGGIGSGKSTVSRILKDLGAVVVDADSIARTVTARGGKALEELVSYFGGVILDSCGELDRVKLADMVFDDPVKLHALDSITHKYITERIYGSIESLRNAGKTETAVIDAPIPAEHGFLDIADEVWVVVAEPDARIRRIADRSGYTPEEALKRVGSQLRDDEYIKLADEVISNNGSIEELEKAAVRLFIQKRQEWQH